MSKGIKKKVILEKNLFYKLLNEKNLTKEELAAKIGVTPHAISCLLSSKGDRPLSDKKIVEIADILGIEPMKLIKKSNVFHNFGNIIYSYFPFFISIEHVKGFLIFSYFIFWNI